MLVGLSLVSIFQNLIIGNISFDSNTFNSIFENCTKHGQLIIFTLYYTIFLLL